MKYRDLIHFEPLVPVQQLQTADAADAARSLVETYVISERMAEELTKRVFPQLRFDVPKDARGLLVVGNYGTGKSHLMSVITAVAEHAALAPSLRSATVADAAGPLAGRFKVARMELGAVEMPLRDAVCEELSAQLAEMGVAYTFPSSKQVINNKQALSEMMAAFGKVYPEQGLLVALDELLDYLRARKEQDLILDLNFLREVGEVCATTRLRFMAGLQESLFDSGRFQFVAETLRRVRDRFDQVRITKEDVSYVVAERLLQKAPEQRAKIREHLTRFAPLYGHMNERMEEFVRLFPVHPAYLSTFEKLYVAEKREVLRTLAEAMERMLDRDVPGDEPGLLAYDSYWDTLRNNATFRSNPDIRAVIDRSRVLEERVQQAYTKPAYKKMALRLVHALSVHRLTTNEIYAALGATPEELRDDLCLYQPGLATNDADLLKGIVNTTLKEIHRTANGQFITLNPDNGQYYLDLKKDIDYAALVEEKAQSLGSDRLNTWFFDVLRQAVLEQPEAGHYKGLDFPIWEHEVEWRERRVTRQGYLFFGTPNSRPTATPPRDFYLYFLPPFDPPHFVDEQKADEVLCAFTTLDEDFISTLRRYAGARELAITAGQARSTYEGIAKDHQKKLLQWLGQHFSSAIEVTAKGVARKLSERMKGAPANSNLREAVHAAASGCLAPWFLERAPEYPTFSVAITTANRPGAALDAVKAVATGSKTKLGVAVLDALELHDGTKLDAKSSRYARYVVEQLVKKGHGQVLRRDEILTDNDGVEYDARFRLEPEWVAVLLVALVQAGELVIALPARKIDASALDELRSTPLADLLAFKHVERPKELPKSIVEELFEFFGLPKSLVHESMIVEGLKQLHEKREALLEQVVRARKTADDRIPFWDDHLLSPQEQAEKAGQLDALKKFLEQLQPYNTPAKLKNLKLTPTDLEAQRNARTHLRQLDAAASLARELGDRVAYLSRALVVLPSTHAWSDQYTAARDEALKVLKDPKQREAHGVGLTLGQKLDALRSDYVQAYRDLHGHARLGAGDDDRKKKLTSDARVTRLNKLQAIELLPVADLDRFHHDLGRLVACISLVSSDLAGSPTCPHCNFRPLNEPGWAPTSTAGDVLRGLDGALDQLHEAWTRTLLDNLADPMVERSLEALTPEQRKVVEKFTTEKKLPAKVSEEFVQVLRLVLKGLEKVVIGRDALRDALNAGGSPCTADELQARFEKLLKEHAVGKDAKRVRWVIG